MLGILAQLPYKDNRLGISTRDEPTNVLYCDYESDSLDFTATLSGLCMGLGISVGLKRLTMVAPFFDSIEPLYIHESAEDIDNKLIKCYYYQ